MCICRWTSSTASCEAASSTFLTRSGQPWGVTSCLGKENRLGPKVKLASWAGQGSFLQFERGRFLHCCIFEVTIYVSDLGAPIVRVTFGFIDSPSVLADGSFGTKVANLLPPSCNPVPLIEPLCCIFSYCFGRSRPFFCECVILFHNLRPYARDPGHRRSSCHGGVGPRHGDHAQQQPFFELKSVSLLQLCGN